MKSTLRTLSVLAEPNRLHIVELLRDGPRPVGEIVNILRLRQPQVSKHLHVLSKAGLVEMHPVAQQRIYKLRPEPLKELNIWLESYRSTWNKRLDRLDDYLIKLQEDEMKQRGKKYERK
ncbi:ArsR/SmtB family transcription factor [Candidatus Nitrosotalea bavarica]|uniref:ArsR/SmtB family transcription factor n=1 Tax=Candidatus Nitrosotalea bavarica TaxID=1903277 RepID=UPI000C70582F|nr:metalloregulator ArsR/SmtB family transcription factor [Candidatus Nitrosotalea bavarica]